MLTEMQVRNAKGRDKDYKLADSDGLYLFVTAKGHRSWRMKGPFAGKERRLVLGAYPELSLRDARDRKADARLLLRDGRDPGIEAVKAKVERAVAAANTFEALARGWYLLRASFSTIMNEWAERSGSPGDRHVIDLILAHVPEGISGSEGAYNRAAYMERRRELLDRWGDMLLGAFPEPHKMLGWPSR